MTIRITLSYSTYRLFVQSYETFLICVNKENEYRGLYLTVQPSITIEVAFPCYLSKSHIIKLTTSYIVPRVYIYNIYIYRA